jgi:hypothetical protein
MFCNVDVLVMFGLGQVFYSAIERYNKRFLLAEVISFLVFVTFGLTMFKINNDSVRGMSLGVLFILTGLGPRIILPCHPIEAGGIEVNDGKSRVTIGIVDFVWLFIMGGTLAFIGFAIGISPFADPIPTKGFKAEYYQESIDAVSFLLGKTLDAFFYLGAILGVCMTILWAGAMWRKTDKEGRKHYKFATVVAIKMIVGFFVSVFGALVWVGVPLYNRMMTLIELLK